MFSHYEIYIYILWGGLHKKLPNRGLTGIYQYSLMGLSPDTKIEGCAGNAGNVFPATDFKWNRQLAIPACIKARCMSGSLTRGGGENVRAIPRLIAWRIQFPGVRVPGYFHWSAFNRIQSAEQFRFRGTISAQYTFWAINGLFGNA